MERQAKPRTSTRKKTTTDPAPGSGSGSGSGSGPGPGQEGPDPEPAAAAALSVSTLPTMDALLPTAPVITARGDKPPPPTDETAITAAANGDTNADNATKRVIDDCGGEDVIE